MNLATRLKQARLNAGLSQKATADLAGVNIRTYQRWEAGDNEPSFSTANNLMEELMKTKPEVAVNSRDTQKAKAAYDALPEGHAAKLAHAGLADPAGYGVARTNRRRANRQARKAGRSS